MYSNSYAATWRASPFADLVTVDVKRQPHCMIKRKSALALVAIFAQLDWEVQGCGISWRAPELRFADVDQSGYVSYSESLGDLDFGQGFVIPLMICFSSDQEASSPYLGKGWMIPLLESHFIQISENTFHLVQPDGSVRPFSRSQKNSSVLDAGPAWRAEIQGDLISVSANCGWRLRYKRGKLQDITNPQNRKFDLIKTRDSGLEIQENGAVKLAVQVSGDAQYTCTISFGSSTLTARQAPRPIVTLATGRRLIAGFEHSLARVEGTNRGSESFSFEVNQDMQPTLKIDAAKTRTFTWDAQTKQIISDGTWRYSLFPPKVALAPVAVSRKNAKGLEESWSIDPVAGVETTRNLDGTSHIERRFVSGALAGKLRSEEFLKDGQVTERRAFSYDESGAMIREIANDELFVFGRSKVGAITLETKYKDSVPVAVKFFDENQALRAVAPVLADHAAQTRLVDSILSSILGASK